MPHEPGRCDFCKADIPSSDFDEGKAMLLLRKVYCSVCLEKTIQKSKTKQMKRSAQKASRSQHPTEKTANVSGKKALPSFAPGAHTCSLHQTDAERQAQVVAFLCEGLWRGEKVAYAIDEQSSERLLGYFQKERIEIQPYLESGQLDIFPATQVYAPEGTFAPERVLSLIQVLEDRMRTSGYKGLRVSGEMTWALRGWAGSDRLLEYERSLNTKFEGSGCTILCQYDQSRFGPEVLEAIRHIHPVVVSGTG
jgi:hypothetical protein